MGRLENDATPNQACSNLVPPPTTEHYHRFTASNHYTAIVQTQSSTAATSHLHTSRAHLNRFEAGFKTTSQKWFTNRFVNRFLNRFSVFTLASFPGLQSPNTVEGLVKLIRRMTSGRRYVG